MFSQECIQKGLYKINFESRKHLTTKMSYKKRLYYINHHCIRVNKNVNGDAMSNVQKGECYHILH